MKKVININFQGRVIPIEETAYELLKQYIESLRRYFANEEGRDEIINDIESRIAELFSERLKKGVTCITDEDVNTVIAGMGRPEDFDAQNGEPISGGTGTGSQQSQSSYVYTGPVGRGRLYRNADDKILAGVCSGLANYLGVDPVVLRIAFVVLAGALFWVYILLWIIVPLKSVQSNITKRLYRSQENKVLGGVCGGLAAYFNIDVWIPRLIFALPFIIGLVSGSINAIWWNMDMDFGYVPRIVSGSFGWTMFVTYVILWIAVPVATTAADKLEMRGEKVDLNSIRNTVKEDLESFKTKAEKWGGEVKQSAQDLGEKAKEFGQSASSQAKYFTAEATPFVRRTGNGLAHVIGVLFKAFFLFLAGMIALALFGVFVGLLFGGFALFPMKDFVLEGFWQNLFAWLTLFLFLGIPIIALITWLVRRIMGARSKNHYLGYVFGSLWVIGLISFIMGFGSISRNFKTRVPIEEPITIVQPSSGKFYIDVATTDWRNYKNNFFGDDDDEWPFYAFNDDSLMLNTVKVTIDKSKDSAFHVYRVKFSRGNTNQKATIAAEKINFDIVQQDSILTLPRGFAISKNEKFRNQQVLVVIEVPVGKKIQFNQNISHYEWFDVKFNRRRGFNVDINDDWEYLYRPRTGVEYIMTPDGPKRTERLDEKELKNGRFKLKIGDSEIEVEGNFDDTNDRQNRERNKNQNDQQNNNRYRYRHDRDSIKKDSAVIKKNVSYTITEVDDKEESSSNTKAFSEINASLSVFTRMFQ